MSFSVNLTPLALTDGIVYGTSVPITITEALLSDGVQVPSTGIVPVAEGQTVLAVVKLVANGNLVSANTFVFLQTDLGDGNWIDVAWCNSRLGVGSQTFILCGGGLGAMNNAFGPLRNQGSAPATQANGSNAVPLGGRIRFTGFTNFAGGSSSVAGTIAGIQATITYKLQNPR